MRVSYNETPFTFTLVKTSLWQLPQLHFAQKQNFTFAKAKTSLKKAAVLPLFSFTTP